MANNIWKKCVEDARLLVMKRDISKVEVCNLCMKAVGSTQWGGGGHWHDFKDQITVTKFANEIGINPKTLLEWLNIKRYVWDLLPKEIKDKPSWSCMARTRKAMKANRENIPSKESVLAKYNELISYMGKPREGYNLKRYLGNVKHALSKTKYLHHKMREEIEVLCCDILEMIRKVGREK